MLKIMEHQRHRIPRSHKWEVKLKHKFFRGTGVEWSQGLDPRRHFWRRLHIQSRNQLWKTKRKVRGRTWTQIRTQIYSLRLERQTKDFLRQNQKVKRVRNSRISFPSGHQEVGKRREQRPVLQTPMTLQAPELLKFRAESIKQSLINSGINWKRANVINLASKGAP